MPFTPTAARAAPLAVVLLLGAAGAAAAQSCGQEIDRLARQYSLDTATPPPSGSSGAPESPAAPPTAGQAPGATTTDKLAQSKGVISPPDVGARMAIQPPKTNPDNMPTAPQVQPSPPGAAGPTGSNGLSAADRTRMESLLTAARNAERQGKETQCLDRLREAAAIPGVPGSSRKE